MLNPPEGFLKNRLFITLISCLVPCKEKYHEIENWNDKFTSEPVLRADKTDDLYCKSSVLWGNDQSEFLRTRQLELIRKEGWSKATKNLWSLTQSTPKLVPFFYKVREYSDKPIGTSKSLYHPWQLIVILHYLTYRRVVVRLGTSDDFPFAFSRNLVSLLSYKNLLCFISSQKIVGNFRATC